MSEGREFESLRRESNSSLLTEPALQEHANRVGRNLDESLVVLFNIGRNVQDAPMIVIVQHIEIPPRNGNSVDDLVPRGNELILAITIYS